MKSRVSPDEGLVISISKAESIKKLKSGGRYGSRTLTADLNNLKYIEKHKNERLAQALYQNSSNKTPSNEFRQNLVYFYSFFLTYLISLAGFFLYSNSQSNLSNFHLQIHLICISCLCISSITLLILLFKLQYLLSRSRGLYSSLILSMCFYLIFCDERILNKITNEGASMLTQPMSLGLICMIAMSRVILFDYYFYISVIGLSTIVTFTIAQLAVHPPSLSACLSEIFLLSLFTISQILESRKASTRIKQLFWRTEQEALKNLGGTIRREPGAFKGINTEAEGIMEDCENIEVNITAISRVVIYKDIKKILKKSLSNIQMIKQKVAHSGFESPRIEMNMSMDEEDRAFIYENFLEPSSVRGSLCQNSSVEFSIKASDFQLLKYGVTELESILSGLGKNWNFDIWFVHDSSGHSVSIVSKYLLQKWGICEALDIPDPVAVKYFEELENVTYT